MSDLATLRDELRESFKDKALASYGKRVSVLKAVRTAINVNYDAAVAALKKDLKRDDSVSMGEINTCLTEIDVQLANLARWMQPEPKSTHMLMTPGHTEVRREPYGVVLVIGPFNYPMNLCLAPAIGALAAGNCVVLKPSEQSTATERWFLNNFAPMVDRSVFRVVAADVARTTALLTLQWDFIFFTGSTFVGRIVSRAAAEHLTPTVMELGGKAPVIVDKSTVHVGEAARRVAWGKWINGGQTCMAPDYVLCHRSKHAEFTAKLTAAQEDFFGKDPSASEDYCRMCTLHHATRALELIEKSTQDDGAKVLCGGAKVCDVAAKYVAPTVVDLGRKGLAEPNACALLQSEMFCPIIAVIPFDDSVDAIATINRVDPQPLALYVFAGSNRRAEKYLSAIQSGDAMVNDTFMHQVNPTTPFGGVGTSGHGTYRGRYSFETFTYQRGVLFRHGFLDVDQTLPFNVRYPPSGKARRILLPRVLQLMPMTPRIFKFRVPSPIALLALSAAAAAFAAVSHGAELTGQSHGDFIVTALLRATDIYTGK